MSELCFSLVLFGPPVVRRIEADGREVELAWRLRRALQVVIFLALQPDRRCDRDKLIDSIWPEAGADGILKNLHPTVTDARRTLAGHGLTGHSLAGHGLAGHGPAGHGPAGHSPAGHGPVGHSPAGHSPERGQLILFRHGVYALSPETEWRLDVESYRRRIEEGRAIRESSPEQALEAWMAAWKLRRGPFVAGTEAPWLSSWREELGRDHLELMKNIGEVCTELDRVTDALDAYRSVLLEEPYEEYVHMKVMELYARLGRRDLVHKQYVRLQEHLKELGVGPLEEAQSCYHRLMR